MPDIPPKEMHIDGLFGRNPDFISKTVLLTSCALLDPDAGNRQAGLMALNTLYWGRVQLAFVQDGNSQVH